MITLYTTQTFDSAQIIQDLQLDTSRADEWLTSPRGFNTIPISIHTHTDDFYYGERHLLPQYKNTELERLWNTLDRPGECQVMVMDSGRCYRSHCDVDNRWQFALSSDESFIVDIENQHLWPTRADGRLYYLNTTFPHSAANFSYSPRFQLIFRQRLQRNCLINPVKIWMHHASSDTEHKNHSRYCWDKRVQSWLNCNINQTHTVDCFEGDIGSATSDIAIMFDVEASVVPEVLALAQETGCDVELDDEITSAHRYLVGDTSITAILKK